MLSRSLPPLDLLVPFEAAARLGSFTSAAKELNVTQSAVSQRVRSLEAHLDVALFVRKHRKIVLTSQGRDLLAGTTFALQHLSAATSRLQHGEQEQHVRLSADLSITDMWVMPRLRRFHTAHPSITIDLLSSDVKEDCLGSDVAILHGDAEWPGFVAKPLFSDDVFPVCAPEYLFRHAISEPADLLTADLIDLDYQRWNWMNWTIWLTETGLDSSNSRRAFQSNSYPAIIDAARGGWGVALGWKDFVDADLRSGTLVRPLTKAVRTRFGYAVLLKNAPSASPAAKLLRDWLADTDASANLPQAHRRRM